MEEEGKEGQPVNLENQKERFIPVVMAVEIYTEVLQAEKEPL